MIVDTSALIAITFAEDRWEDISKALSRGRWLVPATVLTEYFLVSGGSRQPTDTERAGAIVNTLLAKGLEVIAFDDRHARRTQVARDAYGKGNGRGGMLNFGDLMVYAVAKERGEPLLFTGRDFPTTDVLIHPASRVDG